MPSKTSAPYQYKAALFDSMEWALSSFPNTIIMGQGADDHKGIFGTTTGLQERFGKERVYDVPLAEEGMTGILLGAALNGLYPIQTHIRADFSILAMNQIVNLIAKYKYMYGGRFEIPLLIRMVVGRSWGQGAQHSQSFQSLFSHIPGLTVILPSSAQAIRETYRYVIGQYKAPVISIEHRLMYDLFFEERTAFPGYAASPLSSQRLRTGKDVTIVATSIMVLESLRAADYLAKEAGIECEVIDLNSSTHYDSQMIIESIRKTGRLLVADTSWKAYGVSAEICRVIAETAPEVLKHPVKTLGMADAPCPTAKTLEDLFYPNLEKLVDSLATLARGRSDHGVTLPDETSMADVYKRFKGPF